MHGNTPYAGRPGADTPEPTPEERNALRREVAGIAADLRALLPNEFVVGSEIAASTNGPRATVAVQPPAGSVVSAGFTLDDEGRSDLARDLAAGAALEVKRALDEVPRRAH
jgi:hypothetical protein